MYHKYILGLLPCLMLGGCKTIKIIHDEKTNYTIGCELLELKGNGTIINVAVDGNDEPFELNTGKTGSVLLDTNIVTDYTKRPKTYFGHIKGTGGNTGNEKIQRTLIPLKINNKLVSSDNHVFTVIPPAAIYDTDNCADAFAYAGILGYDIIGSSKYPLVADFEHGKICAISNEEAKALAAKGYNEVKSTFEPLQLSVFVSVEGREYRLIFNTGYKGGLILPYKSRKEVMNNDGGQGKELTVSGSVLSSDNYVDGKVLCGRDEISTQYIKTAQLQPTMGMSFIKGFTWIIDYPNKKVYAQRNAVHIKDKTDMPHPCYAMISKGKLLIKKVQSSSLQQYNAGDEIVSVNGATVNASNICNVLQLLNESSDWQALQVVNRKARE